MVIATDQKTKKGPQVQVLFKALGYVVIGVALLLTAIFTSGLQFDAAIASLLVVCVVLLACNPFRIRTHIPLIGDSNTPKALFGWLILIAGGIALSNVVGATQNLVPDVRAAADRRTANAAATAQIKSAEAAANAIGGTATALTRNSEAAPTATAQAVAAANRTATAGAPTPTKVPASPTPAPPTPTPPPRIGDTIAKGNWAYTIVNVTKPGKTIDTGNQFANLDALGTWVVVSLKMQNVGKENFAINAWDFTLIDNSGTKYNVTDKTVEMSIWAKHVGLQQLGQQVPPGVVFTTALLFDVSPSATGLKLNLEQAKTSVELGV